MKSSFKKLLASDKPVLVDFHADWCGPCKMLAPILRAVKEQMGKDIKIIKIDVDKNQPIAARYQIRGVPTLIFFKNGEKMDQLVGAVPEETLAQKLNQFV